MSIVGASWIGLRYYMCQIYRCIGARSIGARSEGARALLARQGGGWVLEVPHRLTYCCPELLLDRPNLLKEPIEVLFY